LCILSLLAKTEDVKFEKVLENSKISIESEKVIQTIKYGITSGEKKSFQNLIGALNAVRFDFYIIKGVSLNESKQLMQNHRSAIFKQYENKKTPYPGEVSNFSICEKKFKPKTHEIIFLDQKTELILTGANQRYNFGVCQENLIKLRAAIVFYYNESLNEFIQLQVFINSTADESKDFLRLLSEIKRFHPLK
jgi:hypothetical protein